MDQAPQTKSHPDDLDSGCILQFADRSGVLNLNRPKCIKAIHIVTLAVHQNTVHILNQTELKTCLQCERESFNVPHLTSFTDIIYLLI